MKNMHNILLFLYIFLLLISTEHTALAEQDAAGKNQDVPLKIELSLSDCERIVLEHSSEIAAAAAEKASKNESIAVAQKDLYPTLSAWYSYEKQLDNSVEFQGFGSLTVEDFYSYGLTIEQPLYRGRSLITAVERSELEYRLSDASLVKVQNDLSFVVHQAYYNLLKAEKMEEVARQALLRLQSHRKDSQSFYDAGLIPKNDLLLSEVELAQGEQDLLEAENQTSMAKSKLNVLMKRPVTTPLTVEDILHYQARPIRWGEILQKALDTRPEIKQREISKQEAEKAIIFTKADYLPTVTLSATYKKQGDTPWADSNPLGSDLVRSAEAIAKWRFWAWGQKQKKVAAAKYQLTKADQAAAQMKDDITLEVRQAFLDSNRAEKNISVTEKAIVQAEENYRISKARYQAQLATSTEVLDAQTLLTRAKTNYYNALYDYKVSTSKLEWAMGVLGEKYQKNNNGNEKS